MVKKLAGTGVALGAAFAVIVATPFAAHAGGVVRDDDGTQDTVVDLDYGDDTAIKRLVLPGGITSGATSATLSVYAKADACGISGASQTLVVNGTPALHFNPCDVFSEASPSWASFSFSPSLLVDGATNSFQIYESAGDWTDRNAFYGVDSLRDYGRSDIYQFSSYFVGDIAGELMWYLTVGGGSGGGGGGCESDLVAVRDDHPAVEVAGELVDTKPIGPLPGPIVRICL